MKDTLTAAQSVLVLGAGSDIARALVHGIAQGGRLRHMVLAGRPGTRRDEAVADLAGALPDATVETVDLDARDIASHGATIDTVFDAGDVDVTVLAFGVLPEGGSLADPVAAAEVVTTNFTGAVSCLTAVAARCRRQGHGTVVVLSSVAGERPRRSNYLYGATKAGLDAFATGLADDLHGSGVHVLVVRPGFVHSAMTAGHDPAPLAVTPDDVAAAVLPHLRGPSRTIWVPAAMRPVMSGLRHLPRAVFRRLPI